MKLPTFLYTPFPRPKRNSKNLLWVILVGMGSSIFILLFNPFDIRNDTTYWYIDLVILGLGVVFIFAILIMEWLIPTLFPKLFKNWTLVKAIFWYSLVILFIGATIFLYKSIWGGFTEFTWNDFLLVLGRTLGISFVISFFVLGIWNYINRSRLSQLTSAENYSVTTQSGKTFDLNLSEILFISSDDNYVDIHIESEGERKKLIVRSSLKNVESQIVNPLSPIVRCHRKFLINSNYFTIQKMTSRNMTVKLNTHDALF